MNARAVALVVALAAAGVGSVAGQAGSGWSVERDPFADLWFHGLSIVGFDGFGDVPLYSPAYAADVVAERRSRTTPTPLEAHRGALLAAFASDPSYEVLHFVPLYFLGVPVEETLDALASLERHGAEHHLEEPGREHPGRSGGTVADRAAASVARVLGTASRHRTVARFVELLRQERVTLGEARGRGTDLHAVADAWDELASGPLADFLRREGFDRGRLILSPALGPEGRFWKRAEAALVMVGASYDAEPGAVVGATIRELCYPAVRRVLGPYERRLGDREVLAEVSHHLATRCGERLLEAHAPYHLPAYRDRFHVRTSGAGFLSAAGVGPGVAVLQGELDRALGRELDLESGGTRPEGRTVGRP